MTATHVAIAAQLEDLQPRADSWKRWSRTEPLLEDFDLAMLRCVLLDTRTPPQQKDDLLGALVRVGRNDIEARLVVISCLLPGLRRAVHRFAHALDVEEAWSELVASLWIRLGTYELDRRPQRIAANLLWDAANSLLRVVRAEIAWCERTTIGSDRRLELLAADGPQAIDAPLRVAVAVGVLTSLDEALIDSTRLAGLDLGSVAALLGLSYEAAKKRRQRAEAAWAAWWAPELLRTSRVTRLSTNLKHRPAA